MPGGDLVDRLVANMMAAKGASQQVPPQPYANAAARPGLRSDVIWGQGQLAPGAGQYSRTLPNRAATQTGPQAAYTPGVEQNANLMAVRGGQPVYYGTDAARALALRGLQRIAAHYGTNSHQFRVAAQAAAGVFGPDYQAPPDAFSTAALSAINPNPNAGHAAARAAILNTLSGIE